MHVRTLIRKKLLVGVKLPSDLNQFGYVYDISEEALEEFLRTPPRDTRGWPRGKKRKP
jgi:hypothetical protein